MKKLLIANRGEIAIRIAQAATELGIENGRHLLRRRSDISAHQVRPSHSEERAASAYLDIIGVIAAARRAGCDAVHPGYGFLSENAAFATACAAMNIAFVEPTPDQVDLFGDKASVRAHAKRLGVPVLPGTGVVDLAGATGFFRAHASSGIALKAIAGGGGHGMRVISAEIELADAFARASAEAKSAFGKGELFAERLVKCARHIEVQIVGDGKGGCRGLG